MGGVFSAPAPPPMPPLPPAVDPGEEERKRRLEDVERRRRGLSGTVHTGFAGLSEDDPETSKSNAGGKTTGKTLLGD